jgi:hypothetical protein
VYDWPHETTPAAMARNRKGVANFARMLKEANAAVRAFAEQAGLKTGTTIGVIEAGLRLRNPCGIEYRLGVSGSRCSAGSNFGNL